MRLDKCFHDGEAETLAFFIHVFRFSFLENLVEKILTYARAVVGHSAFHAASVGQFPGVDDDVSTRRVLDSVRNQIPGRRVECGLSISSRRDAVVASRPFLSALASGAGMNPSLSLANVLGCFRSNHSAAISRLPTRDSNPRT